MIKKKVEKKHRAWELDFLRGLSILMVLWDHTNFSLMIYGDTWRELGAKTLTNISDFSLAYWQGNLRAFFWPVFVFIFFFVSGICTSFSRNNLLRGIKLAGVALFVTLATYVAEKFIFQDEGYLILFGVLHCLAVCILIYSIIQMFFDNVVKNKWAKMTACFVVAVIVFILNAIYNVPVTSTAFPKMDSLWYGLFIYTHELGMITADYFPLMPFLGYFMLGAGLSVLLYPKKESLLPRMDGKWNKLFTLSGRWSLIIYLMIQVVVMGTLSLITMIISG